ncbi:DUF4328 domain-containing protein [Saccharopolyspora sp. TS4A08]|uniref:DUF4328 domain-containing protein n=1 Tax=Saccharopolyspora ipomoeae TaxID=3042027 RepID=A0ABT6PXF4_9PSEU|nr:DUF4328 domain-containing protein [Saccharopolyspora sp. TS4A08]MDI2032701.1 DUF4328 domain-containing protein [Saccharopolyspora sp. TS4A08]
MATPPGGPRRTRPPRRPRPYAGPPSYPAPPRWGFPLLAWRWPLALPTHDRVDHDERAGATAATAIAALWVTAGVAALATVAEVWRYVLLLLSRGEALSRTVLAISDALVGTTGVILVLMGVLTGVFTVLWGLRARAAAAERIGVRPARPDWQVVAGVLVPGLNALVPGSAMAELEHCLLVAEGDRDRGARPSPSLRVRFWWALWAATVLVGLLTFGWTFRDGVQALADGVVLHAVNNALVAVLAVVTARLIDHLMRLLLPPDPTELSLLRVHAVRAAPPPERAPRPGTAPR